jgi:hypothetical protein
LSYRSRGSVGAGGTFSLANDKYAVYGEVSHNTSLIEPGESYACKGTADFRMRCEKRPPLGASPTAGAEAGVALLGNKG